MNKAEHILKQYQKVFIPIGTLWQDAIKNYLAFFTIDLKEHLDLEPSILDFLGIGKRNGCILNLVEMDDEYEHLFYKANYIASTAISNQDLRVIEDSIGKKLPEKLRSLYLNNGGFKIGVEQNFFSIFTLKQTSHTINNEFFIKKNFLEANVLTCDEYHYFENRFLIIGSGSFGDSHGRNIVLFYDFQIGQFGEICLLPDECPNMKKNIFPKLFSGELSGSSLDEVIINQINRILFFKLFDPDYGLLSGNEIEDDEYSRLVTSCPAVLL